jgi:hypothetical protein
VNITQISCDPFTERSTYIPYYDPTGKKSQAGKLVRNARQDAWDKDVKKNLDSENDSP